MKTTDYNLPYSPCILQDHFVPCLSSYYFRLEKRMIWLVHSVVIIDLAGLRFVPDSEYALILQPNLGWFEMHSVALDSEKMNLAS